MKFRGCSKFLWAWLISITDNRRIEACSFPYRRMRLLTCIPTALSHNLLQCLGQLGQVVHILPNGNVKVIIKGQRWILSPETIVPAPGETPPEYTAGM